MIRRFESVNGLDLIVKNRKSAVILELEESSQSGKYDFIFEFTENQFKELVAHLEFVSNESWANFTPKEVNSMGSDYYEYYDKKLDCNGYLSFKGYDLVIERPSVESHRLYQFNKRKMESLIYDFQKQLDK